jgi:hypothetical protein
VYDGVAMFAEGIFQGFAKQHVSFDDPNGYNDISYNGSDGIFAVAYAAVGGSIDQHLYVYHTDVDHNAGSGVAIRTQAAGYAYNNGQVYYSHIQQNLIFAYGSISHNGANGVTISNAVTYTPQVDQIVQFYGETVDHNAGNGLVETSTVKTYQGGNFAANTVLHSDLYLQGSDFSYNGASGISISSHLNSPTYILGAGHYQFSYLQQHINATYVTANHNGASGFVNKAYDQGVYGINIQYVTLASSQFNNNAVDGAQFVAHQVFGPGSFGAAEQIVTLSGSQFNHNTANGLYASAYAGGNQGRAEQHFTVQGSYFNNNSANGIDLKRTAENGVYVSGLPCTAVQGLAGGCAFVRQTFDMVGGSASHNSAYGINISGYATNYGALYTESGRPAHVPNVYLKSVHVDGNTDDGFYSSVVVKNHSYAYNYIVTVGSTFDSNGKNGFATNTYAGGNSSIVERNALFSYHGVNSASNNGEGGVYILDRTLNTSATASTNILYGLTAQHNGTDGVAIVAGSYGSTHQYNYFGSSVISYNGHNGVTLLARGAGVGIGVGNGQYSRFGNINYATGNAIAHNSNYGVYGLAANSGYQLVNIYTNGNTVTGNAAGNYFFTTSAGGFSNVY